MPQRAPNHHALTGEPAHFRSRAEAAATACD